jgi:hypothetical protein
LEEKIMKKTNTILAGTLILMCFFVTTALADVIDLNIEGKKLVEASQQLIADGQVLQNCTGQDRVKMVDEGHMMIKKGRDIISDGAMMHSAPGRSNMLEVGQTMIHGGNMLLKKGKQQEELTAKEKTQIKKLGNTMTGLGNMMLEKGKLMTGE